MLPDNTNITLQDCNMKYGFVRIASAVPETVVADCKHNIAGIEKLMREAEARKVRIMAFPEMCITSYTCADLFFQDALLDEAESCLQELAEATRDCDVTAIVGMPVRRGAALYNCAVVMHAGRLLGAVPKTYLPNYAEFYEQRWFSSGKDIDNESIELCGMEIPFGTGLMFRTPDCTFSIEICEDLWATVPPSSIQALNGAEIVFNLSADNDVIGKYEYLKSILSVQSAKCICGYAYASAGPGESTTDVVFDGKSFIYENGTLLEQSERFPDHAQLICADVDTDFLRHERKVNTTFAENAAACKRKYNVIRIEQKEDTACNLLRHVSPAPFTPEGENMDEKCREIFSIQTAGLAKRMLHTHSRTAVLGISGGLDSTLALLATVKTFDRLGLPREGITGITMPGFGTTGRTHDNSVKLMQSFGVTTREIPIRQACLQHFSDIGHDADVHDVTYENSQARERTQIIMDVANQVKGLAIGTGDLSELALGWATYNGDHMSMYGINAGVPKTLVRHLVEWFADNEADSTSREILKDIADTPISPELIPADENGKMTQKTEDIVGPYELHDFFLYHMLRCGAAPAKIQYLAETAFRGKYDSATIRKWLETFIRRFFSQQFKRSCLPDGPKVGSVSLSPRGDLRMPSDASPATWINNLKQ